MRRLLVLLALLSTLGVAACGSDDSGAPSSGARSLVQRALDTPVKSGRLDLKLGLRVAGVRELADGVKLELKGPFSSNGRAKLPSADLDLSAGGLGPGLGAGLVLTGDNAYVSFGGRAYEVGEDFVRELNSESRRARGGRESLEDFGIDPVRWIRAPEVAGHEEVAGTETTKVSGDVDVRRVLSDVAKLGGEVGSVAGRRPFDLTDADQRRIVEAVKKASIDLYVAGDGTLRRAVLDVRFEVPEEERRAAGGAEGGSAMLDLALSDVGEAQHIEAPANARPLRELLEQFGLGPESFLQ